MGNEHLLQGLRILLTRPSQSAAKDEQLIKRRNGVPISIPLIQTSYVYSELENEILQRLEQYDWIVFTSQNTVEYMMQVLERYGRAEWLHQVNIAAIGQKTEERLQEHGFTASFMPSTFQADEFVNEFPFHTLKASSILFPQGNLARDIISASFRERGIPCTKWILYETTMPSGSCERLINHLMHDKLDILTFASPSAVMNFMLAIQDQPYIKEQLTSGHWTVACIGPTTKQAALAYELPVHIQPAVYTMSAMLEDIVSIYMKNVKEE
ncbi:uroporphyrinogen-III synthase [Jeotgalibacillus soli]|uniref:Uroporphyrinogen-III synthase n=1 Tax=Jeotgalibacillus soli TaxID=889306 RepID=A0A0C2VKS8_9BACL|nr:uroporphyrinogen-III synthase [Jeotgalibacillus soli]KIL44578.1 uroporphyrinogen-III synthase [Jeotgalibacillus soli]